MTAVYRPDTELASHHWEAPLPVQLDASHAVSPRADAERAV